MTSTGAVAGVAFLAYLEHPLAPRPRPGQIVVLDRLGGAPQTGGAGGDRSAGVRVGAVAWVRPGLQPQRVGFQQDRGVRESCGGEDEGERWTLRSRLRWGRCRWGMWWVGLSMPESRITHFENRCRTWGGLLAMGQCISTFKMSSFRQNIRGRELGTEILKMPIDSMPEQSFIGCFSVPDAVGFYLRTRQNSCDLKSP